MRTSDRYDGSNVPFQGDLTLLVQSIPAGARVTKATLTLTPTKGAQGELFEENIFFANGQGDWGATKAKGDGFVEVDFHARRTLGSVAGTNIAAVPGAGTSTGAPGANLQVDLGGIYVEINDKGAIKSPSDTQLFQVPADGKLPGLTVNKFKLTRLGSLDISHVTIRSFPTNISVRLGQMPPFLTRVGELVTAETSPDFAAVLNAFLADAEPQNGFYPVPLVLHSDTIARLQIDLEIEYLVEARVLPTGLNEVALPFDFGSLPNADQNVLQVAIPANARVAPRGTSARVTGVFEETRIVHGPTGAISPAGTVEVSPALAQAQLIALTEAVSATAIDLLVTITRTARLQLNLRDDLDGKPDNASLLPAPVVLDLFAPVGQEQDRQAVGQPGWVSVQLSAEFQFQTGKRYWLILQSIDGELAWSVAPAPTGTLGMQRTQDGGLSWRETVAAGVSGPVAAFFRLRRKPERFQVPIELQVGAGEPAVRVKLDRFQPLGRVDFALDFDEVAQAFNQYLARTSPVSCPEIEHLVNGDFEEWLVSGDQLGEPAIVALNGKKLPTAIAMSPDGRTVYVGVPQGIQVVDAACHAVLKEFETSNTPNVIAFNPLGSRAYVIDGMRRGSRSTLLVIDTEAHRQMGKAIELNISPTALAASPDGNRLYLAAYHSSTVFKGWIYLIDTHKLEQVILKDNPTLSDVQIGDPAELGENRQPTDLALSPEGSILYVTVGQQPATGEAVGEVQVLDTMTLPPVLTVPAVSVGKDPRAIALTPDGKWAVVVNAGDDNVSIIDTARKTVVGSSIPVGDHPVAVAISPEGTRAYIAIANEDSEEINVIDLLRRDLVKSETVQLESSPIALALTPQGDRLYLVTAVVSEAERELFVDDFPDLSLASIPIGMRLPAEWNLTSGSVAPMCLPDLFHLVAVLGRFSEESKLMPTALSQVVPVAGSCLYEFSFWGIATELDAMAEVLWLNQDCGLLRTDRILMEVRGAGQSSSSQALAANVGCFEDQEPQLVLHRSRLMAPAGATQAETRFTVPTGVCAAIDLVSLIATNEAVSNADLSQQQDGQLSDWSLLARVVTGVSLIAVEGAIQFRNAGADVTELVQAIPAKGNQPFIMEFQGRAITRPSAQANPRVELRWLKADKSFTGSPTILEILPTGFDSVIASGTSPTDTAEAEIHLVVPTDTTLEIKRISLRFSTPTLVPVTFVAQAPGELTVSDFRVTFEQAGVAAPPVPETGLCTPTPPGRQPSKIPSDCRFCPCCETERTMTDIQHMETRAGRPAQVGHCGTCGTELVRFGGSRVAGARPFTPRPAVGRRPAVLSANLTTLGVMAKGQLSNLESATTPLTIIDGIGEVRARRLAEIGIDSLEKLAKAAPDDVAKALRGVSPQAAADFIVKAKQLSVEL